MMKFALSPLSVTITTLKKRESTSPAHLTKSCFATITEVQKSRTVAKSSKRHSRNLKKRVPLLVSALAAAFCSIASADLQVSAANLEPYTLTVAQTLALYGQSIPVEIYANNATYTKDAVYVGDTNSLTLLNGYPQDNTQITYCSGNSYDNRYQWGGTLRIQDTNFLIYRVAVDPWSPPYSESFSINLTNSIDITAGGFGSQILWSAPTAPLYSNVANNNAVHSYTSCNYTLYGESVQDVETVGSYLAAGTSGTNLDYYGTMYMLPYGCEIIENQGTFNFSVSACIQCYGAVAFAGSTVSGGEPVTVGSQTLFIKNEGNVMPKTAYSINTMTYYNKKQQQGDNSDYACYLFIQCPTLYGDYTLPGDDDSGDVDLSQIESYLSEQSDYLENISEESTVQTRQLIAILAKLEQIYQAMQNSGFNPQLNPTTAQTLPRLDWTAQQSAIATGTIAAGDIQSMTPAAEVLTDEMSGLLSDSGLTLFAVGLVSMCAAGWFLTRGRG